MQTIKRLQFAQIFSDYFVHSDFTPDCRKQRLSHHADRFVGVECEIGVLAGLHGAYAVGNSEYLGGCDGDPAERFLTGKSAADCKRRSQREVLYRGLGVVGAEREAKSASGQHCGGGNVVVCKLGLATVAENRAEDYRGAVLREFVGDEGAVGAVYQHVVKTELVREALRCENIVGAVAVEVRLERVILVEQWKECFALDVKIRAGYFRRSYSAISSL